ncbi:MAG: hypothetical protein WD426_13175 [Anditalea sp.]
MIKKVKRFLNLLVGYYNKKPSGEEISLPEHVSDDEKIVRSIFSPLNINLKTNKLKSNAFKSPAGKDEVSVIRYSFNDSNFCKSFSRKIQDELNNKIYCGLAVLNAFEIRNLNANIIYSPIKSPIEFYNPYHGDIKIGYAPIKGEPLPAEFQHKVQKLANSARVYIDPDPFSKEWQGEEIK